MQPNNLTVDNIDLFVFHQANKYVLEYLYKKIKVPQEKFYINLENVCNTISLSISMALSMAESDGMLVNGNKVMLVGFGVWLSWGATVIRWQN